MIAISANDFGRTVLCDRPGCTLDAEFGTTRCREHAGDIPERAPSPIGRPSAYSRNQILGAIDRWATEHDGVPPKSFEWARACDYWPNMTTVVRVFGKWSAALTAAGYERNYHARHRRTAVSEREPEADEARGSWGAADELSASTPAPSRARASSRSETAERDLLDDLYDEAAA